jgi:hypothetical protein
MSPKRYIGRTLTILLLFFTDAISIEAVEQTQRECQLIVISRTVSIGENPRMISGRSAVYWLASYEIVEVIKGRPSKTQIGVAHLVMKGNELENLRIGDKVLLCLKRPNRKLKDAVLLSADYVGKLMLECDCGK